MFEFKFSHYADKKIETLNRERVYDQNRVRVHSKPHGLWLSVDGEDDWAHWCMDEGFGLNGLEYRHEVIFHLDAKIIVLATSELLREFTKKYPRHEGIFTDPKDTHELDWFKIREDYQGIVIAPYHWDCRLTNESSWYYGWDCASGCVWDLSAVKEFNFVEQKDYIAQYPHGECYYHRSFCNDA